MSGYLLIGAVGGPNFGDEAILAAWLDCIRRADPDARIFCDGYDSVNLKACVAGRAGILTEECSLWGMRQSFHRRSTGDSVWSTISEVLGHGETLEKVLNLSRQLIKIRITHIHFIGGGYFNSLWSDNYALLTLARLVGWAAGICVTASGQGITPTDEIDRPGLVALLRTFDAIDVRDEASFDLLNSTGMRNLSLTGDDALLHLTEAMPGFCHLTVEPAFIVCLQNDLFPGDNMLSRVLSAGTLKRIRRAGMKKIILVEAMVGDSVELGDLARTECEAQGFAVEVLLARELLAKGMPVHPEGMAFTSRYHPHFFGALSGMRGIALASNRYYEIKHEAVRAMGSNWPLLMTADAGDIESLLDEVLTPSFEPRRSEVVGDWLKRKLGFVEKLQQMRSSVSSPFPIDIMVFVAAVVDERSAEADAQRKLLAKANTELAACSKALAELEGEFKETLQILSREQELQEAAQTRIRRMRKSRSWRATSPFRKLAALFRGGKVDY